VVVRLSQGEGTMSYIFVKHNVKDFDQWQKAYDSDLKARESWGFKELGLWHTHDNKNEVEVLFEVPNVEKAREFFNNDELKAKMEAAGVTETPKVWELDKIR
jgi:hypothetical protein